MTGWSNSGAGSWDDTNDSHYLALYKQSGNMTTVLALCFTQASETYRQWRVFADGSSGVCISFDRAELLEAVKRQPGIRARPVRYLKIRDLESEVRTSGLYHLIVY
jgi:hypothetical protein